MSPTNKTASHRALLPPWGYMDEVQLYEAATLIRPRHWTSPSGGQPTDAEWFAWLATVIDAIDSLVWPKYVPRSATWGTAYVRNLNDVDFLLLERLHANLEDPISTGFPNAVVHRELYLEEDKGEFLRFERYDPLTPLPIRDALPEKIREGMRFKAGTTTLQLKKVFQRPRPYQVAFLQSRTSFACLHADSADTPALASGHCYQGIMGVCNAFVELGSQCSANTIAMLGQLAVDIGDRRVFAGIHYPSDSMSSWLTALMALPRVFTAAQVSSVRRFLWNAISTKSVVYKAVEAHSAQRGSPYAKCVRRMKELSAE